MGEDYNYHDFINYPDAYSYDYDINSTYPDYFDDFKKYPVMANDNIVENQMWDKKFPSSVIFVLVFMSLNTAVGLAGNTAVAVLISTRAQFRSCPSNIYILNRAFGDLMQQSTIPLVMASWLIRGGIFNKTSCLVCGAVVHVGFLSSALFLVFLSYDGLLLAKSESSHRQTILWRVIPAIWITFTILTIPNYWIQEEDGLGCRDNTLFYLSSSYMLLPIIILLFIIIVFSSIFLHHSRQLGQIRSDVEEGQVKWSTLVSEPGDRDMNEDKMEGDNKDNVNVVNRNDKTDETSDAHDTKGRGEDRHGGFNFKPEANDTDYSVTEDSTDLIASEKCEAEIKGPEVVTTGSSKVPRSLITVLITIFAVCQIPFWVYDFIYIEFLVDFGTYFNKFLTLLLLLNPTINSILWLVWNKEKIHCKK